MPEPLGHWIAPFLPVVLMLSIVIMNHVVAGQRNDKKTASEMERFSAALTAELRALHDLYQANLGLIERKADYILSTRSTVVVYKGNLGRLTMLLDKPAIAEVVAVFAQNERIETVIAAHSNFKCNLTYQFTPSDGDFAEWKTMYEEASRRIVTACRALEAGVSSAAAPSNALPWRTALGEFLERKPDFVNRRWIAG